jgi:hypothetical protein
LTTQEIKTTLKQSDVWHVLVFGLHPEISPTRFSSGLSIRTLDCSLTIFDLAATGAAGFHAWATLEPWAAGCKCEFISSANRAVDPGYDALNRAWLLSSLIALRGFGNHLCLACSSYSWNIVAGHQSRTKEVFEEQLRQEGIDAAVYASKRKLPTFHGSLLDYHLKVLCAKNSTKNKFTKEDAFWVDARFDTFNKLSAESESFRFALEASIDWRYASDLRSAIARIWAGIESLFGVNSELVYRVSLLCACMLAPRGYARKTKFAAVKALYAKRSKAVHGEPMSEEVLLESINLSYELLRDLLLSIVGKGRPLTRDDMDEAVFL